MKESKNKSIDKLTERVLNASEIETPSNNFTHNIMTRIDSLESKQSFSYTPLISKTVFFVIGTIIAVLLIALNAFNVEPSVPYLSSFIESNNLNMNFLSLKGAFTFSKVTIYAIILFGLMFSLQIPILKYYYFSRKELY